MEKNSWLESIKCIRFFHSVKNRCEAVTVEIIQCGYGTNLSISRDIIMAHNYLFRRQKLNKNNRGFCNKNKGNEPKLLN